MLAIAAIAVTLRFWRLGWGIDERVVFPDEQIYRFPVLRAFAPPSRAASCRPT